ncbi:immunoglobulin-like domain-containing protein [Enterococcus hirae]|uniref:immunoglobulin-like domain-containing protein n=1 Tax=Enterococcus hirae TaxID=1354 RepID=UPI001F1E165B|nr:immunoglobulin-like domain-containing protein [Enterococcus hirae]MDL4888335.1 toxin Cry1Ac domain D-VI-related protein [Enterococcus hirae]MDL4891190.1 toxin Cry1Ac domain D-VI-related protein [Enterococcus hirae]MDL4897386.1 toxin Cry1Ac domain D-VI-related protein [Enterococcus hirae]MDL4899979.1 toxin Cry1Ac domain D-VI-related protein [Enterococcus hirae]MDL4902545.1 toxin Cry1Ac domain D-VI-related protein [Enterococcus hirae]
MLVSSAASAGTSLVYAAEKNQTATTAEKNTKNSEAISNENTLTQKQNLTATERKTVNPSNFDWNIGEVLPSTPTNNYSGTLPNTVRGATFQITFSIFKQPSSTLTANDIKVNVQGKNVKFSTSQYSNTINVQVTFQAEGTSTNFSINVATGKGDIARWNTSNYRKFTDVPQSAITSRNRISTLLDSIYSTSGVLAPGVTQSRIDNVRQEMNNYIPRDISSSYISAYWANFLTPFLDKASAEVDQINKATVAVNNLFNDNQVPKPNNTSEQVNAAKALVNALPYSQAKEDLLAKVAKAQNALDEIQVNAATEAVDALFNGDTPKPENTQEQINAAKAKVDALTNETVKTALLAKITAAQQALDEATEEAAKVQAATEAVNALFNGDTPKPENTQEQINAAKAKVDALKASETKTELLAKIQKAQEALEEKSKQTLTLNPYTLGDQYVTGTITGNIKKFQLIVNGQTYEPGFKLKNGKLEVYVGNRVPEGTTEFTLKAFNPAGTQVASQTVQVQAPSLSVDKFVLGSEYMTGSYQGNSINKFRLTVDGKVYEPGFKLENGKFEVYIGSKITGSSKVIKLEALDKAGKTIVEQNVTVEAPQLTINEYIRGNEYLTGTVAGEGVKKFKLIINGQESFPGFKLTDGKFEIYVGNKVPANVNSIKVVGIDKTGQEIVSQDVNVQNPELQPNEYLAGNEYLTGTFTGQAIKKFKLVVNGQENYPGFKITEGNKFEVYIGNKVPVGTTTFTLIGLDKSGQQLTSKEITVQSPTLSINEYVRGDEYMRGTFNGDGIKKFKLVVDGQESNPGFKITGENQFEVYIGNKITADSKSIKLEGLDKSGNVLVSQEVSVSQPELVPNEYTRNSEYLTGTYKGDIRSIKLTVDNKEYKPGFKLKEGNQFEVYIGNKIPASANSFTIESLSFDGKQLVSVNVPVK